MRNSARRAYGEVGVGWTFTRNSAQVKVGISDDGRAKTSYGVIVGLVLETLTSSGS